MGVTLTEDAHALPLSFMLVTLLQNFITRLPKSQNFNPCLMSCFGGKVGLVEYFGSVE